MATSPTEIRKLDFVGIGVQKSASTWLFECLLKHPDIRGPVGNIKKELNFFNKNYAKGYAWYHKRFEFGPWKTGEYSVSYFRDNSVPERIYRYNPNVKLLLSLRNPIDRALSQHYHQVRRNRLPKKLYGFWDALEQNPTYIEQGKYVSLLKRYLEFFDHSQIFIVLFDDICSEPIVVLRNLFSFLGVNSTFQPSLVGDKTNVAHMHRSLMLHRFIETTSRGVRHFLGESFLEALKATKIPTLIRRYNEIEIDERTVPPLSEDERKRLHDVFSEENERLGILIGRDLSHWK